MKFQNRFKTKIRPYLTLLTGLQNNCGCQRSKNSQKILEFGRSSKFQLVIQSLGQNLAIHQAFYHVSCYKYVNHREICNTMIIVGFIKILIFSRIWAEFWVNQEDVLCPLEIMFSKFSGLIPPPLLFNSAYNQQLGLTNRSLSKIFGGYLINRIIVTKQLVSVTKQG